MLNIFGYFFFIVINQDLSDLVRKQVKGNQTEFNYS
jgi:hypothetical protein